MHTLPNETNEIKSASGYTYKILKEKILHLELKPGTRISEKEVAEKFEVSRTPVRESFLKLAQEDLLEIYPQRGTTVSLIDLDQVEEARFVRENIERAIVRVACEDFPEEHLFEMETNLMMQKLCGERGEDRLYNLDDEFHKILFYGCGKIRTWYMMQQMNSHFNRLRKLRLSATSLNWDIIISQHEQIFHLIQTKNPEKADEVVVEHLRLAMMEKDILVDRYPDYFAKS